LKYGSEVTEGYRNRHRSIRHLWLLLMFHSNITTKGLSRTVSEINGDFSRKSQKK